MKVVAAIYCTPAPTFPQRKTCRRKALWLWIAVEELNDTRKVTAP